MTVAIPNARLRMRPWWVLPFALVWGFGGLLPTMVAMLAALVSTPLLLLVPVLYFGVLVACGRGLWQRRTDRNGSLRADEKGVYLDGKLVAARRRLTHGHVVEVGRKTFLRLVARAANRAPVDIEVADEAQATELLSALHLNRTVAEYNLLARHLEAAKLRLAATFGGSIMLAFGSMITFAILLDYVSVDWRGLLGGLVPLGLWMLGMVGAIFGAVSRETFVSVGEDGIWLRRPYVEKRFISFRDVVSIEQDGRDLTLKLKDNSRVAMHHKLGDASVEDLLTRVRAGITTFRSTPKRTAEAIGRNGRTIADWIASVRKQHERAANYRTPVVPQDELWRIVEDASANPTERAGAALALRADLDDEGKTRLRIAAGACAEHKLRVALESVTKPNEAELIDALEPLEDERPSRRYLGRPGA